MIRSPVARRAARIVPLALLLASFGRLVAHPTYLLADADRPTVDHARVIAAAPGNDLTRQFWPVQLAVARSIARTGHLPQWDDRGFGGRPLVGNPQAGLFYPPAWLAWLVPAPATLGWITLGHLAWGGLGMGRLGRTLGLGDAGRMMAAGCFSLAPYVLAQAYEGHYPHVWAVAWYPWAFDATIRLGRGEWRAGLLLAAGLAATVLVGHPQEGYYLAVALAGWGAAGLIRLARAPAGRRRLAPTGAAWVGVGMLTLGLAAAELVPGALAQGWALRSERLPIRLASRYHPQAINALQLINPFALGGPVDYLGPENYWETVTSIGLVPAFLALVGATSTRDRRRVRGWAALVVLAVVFALGRRFGLFAVLYELVPGMDRFRVPARSLFLANLGAAVLVGFGVEALGDPAGDDDARWVRLARRWGLVACLIAAAAAWGAWRTGRPEPAAARSGVDGRGGARASGAVPLVARGLGRLPREPACWVAGLGLSAGLAWGLFRPRWRSRVALGLGGLGLVELAILGHQLLGVAPPAAFLRAGPAVAALDRAGPPPPGQPPPRIRADDAEVSDLVAADLGLGKTDIADSFQIQHAADLYQRLYDLSRPRPDDLDAAMDGPAVERTRRAQQAVFDRMSVGLVALAPGRPRLAALLAANRWPIVAGPAGAGRVAWARNPTALPRAYVVPRVAVAELAGPRAADRLAAIDPRRLVVMERDPLAAIPPDRPRQAFRAADWESTDPDRLVLRVATAAPGLLVVADTWMPGWSARVDGRPAVVGRGDHAQRVVALPDPGLHEVVLTYRAPGLRAGLAVSTASALAWLALAWAGRTRARGVI